ncbi:biliverdin-producing heme oxygenase (plasmid) [Niveispirillum fermenti]
MKAATGPAHTRLDQAIMRRDPFASRERYALFLAVQHAFHRDVDALYVSPALNTLLPGLAAGRRLDLITQDQQDLGHGPADFAIPDTEPVFAPGAPMDLPTALGWLYVAEGSNLGAAYLLKEAAKLGLSERFGARHLAGAAAGRGLHWRTFTSALDAIPLSSTQDAHAADGARAAFARVQGLVDRLFGRTHR